MRIYTLFLISFCLLIFSSSFLNAETPEKNSNDKKLKWKRFKSKAYSFKCKIPKPFTTSETEHEFGKQLQISSEHEFLSFFISALEHKNDLSKEDPEDLSINATYNFVNAIQGEMIYMRAIEHEGVPGYEARMQVDDGMQARYAVFFKGQMQYQLVMVFLSDEDEKHFHKLLKKLKF